jgi:hypothetical protein
VADCPGKNGKALSWGPEGEVKKSRKTNVEERKIQLRKCLSIPLSTSSRET